MADLLNEFIRHFTELVLRKRVVIQENTIFVLMDIQRSTRHRQSFSQMGIQASCGPPFIKDNHFVFHMLPYKFFS